MLGHSRGCTIAEGVKKLQTRNHLVQIDISLIRQPEHELEAVLFGVKIPMRPIPIASIIGLVLDFPSWDAERNGLVWLGSDLQSRRQRRT